MPDGMLSQEEINALLKGTADLDAQLGIPPEGETLTDLEKDTLGEIANISMGTAATTLSQILNKKVDITTPTVELMTSEDIQKEFPIPSVVCDVKYKEGLEGSNLLILSQRDGSVIVDLMMGGPGNPQDGPLNEMQISGISEAMNQMMGSSATSMSTMFTSKVDITPPSLTCTDLGTDSGIIQNALGGIEPLVRIAFRMVVVDVIDSKLTQVIPITVAKGMVNKLMSAMTGEAAAPSMQAAAPVQPTPIPAPASNQIPPQAQQNYGAAFDQMSAAAQQPAYAQGGAQGNFQQQPQANYQPQANFPPASPTPVQPAQFSPLQGGQAVVPQDNLNLILDVPLQISVELGRAKKTIKEILEMGPGSVVELDRLAGESVDMIVNGKFIAKCEVIVINETFGIRVTDIIQPAERVNSFR